MKIFKTKNTEICYVIAKDEISAKYADKFNNQFDGLLILEKMINHNVSILVIQELFFKIIYLPIPVNKKVDRQELEIRERIKTNIRISFI